MSAMDIGNRLKDPNWKGLDGKGPYDVALFMGLPYYMEFVILSGLKHFSAGLKTISLDRYYSPHATWSFPNLKAEEWNQSFETIVNKLEEK
jgi:acetyl-CoA decarbonylase/synthase complex subunit epsilon